MKRRIFTTAFLVCLFIAGFAAIADISGKWAGTVIGPDGNSYPLAYTFKSDGNKLTGTSSTSFGESTIDKGMIKGDSIFFSTNINGMDVPHSGKYMKDSVSLNINYGGTMLHTVLKHADK